MNQDVRKRISATINQLYEQLDRSYEIRKKLDYDKHFERLITNTTRIKILNQFIALFKSVKKGIPITAEQTQELTKRIRIHFTQLRKLKNSVDENVIYFTTLMRVLFRLSIIKRINLSQ